MNADGSGGGTPGQQSDHAPTPASDESIQSVDELFSVETEDSSGAEPVHDVNRGALDPTVDPLDGVGPNIEGRRPPRRGLIRRWTVLTVALSFLAAAMFTVLSLRTDSQLAAFSAGLMVGVGGLFIGWGTLLGRNPTG